MLPVACFDLISVQYCIHSIVAGWRLMWYRPVGSGKTALMLALSKALRDEYNIAAVTNDIFTRYPPSLLPYPIQWSKSNKETEKTPNS